jgi:PIN domain nuclease of toxin-antitoxin system
MLQPYWLQYKMKQGDFVKQNIEQSVISSVNWPEVLQKMMTNNMKAEHIETMLIGLGGYY